MQHYERCEQSMRAVQADHAAPKLIGGQMRRKVRRHPLRATNSEGGYNLQH
jgi:hypothetical protein